MRTHGNASSNDTFAFDDTPLSAQIQQSQWIEATDGKRDDGNFAGARESVRPEPSQYRP